MPQTGRLIRVALLALGSGCARGASTSPAANLTEFQEQLAALQSLARIP